MFYGWWVVASVFVAQFFMVGFFTYTFPLILVPVRESFGATATEVNLAMTVSTVTGILLPPLVGPLVDGWSARKLMMVGAVMFSASLGLLSLAESVAAFILIFAVVLAPANTLLGPITGSALVSRWFVASRGKALGVAATGTSVGGIVLPFLISDWLGVWGWRGSLQALGVLVAVFTLPMLTLALRDHPADKGVEAEGQLSSQAAALSDSSPLGLMGTRDVLRSRAYWVIGTCLGLLFMAYMGLLGNMGLYVEGRGMEASFSVTLMSLIAFCGLIGKIVVGSASDRIGLRPGLWVSLALAAAGIALFSTEPGETVLMLAACLLGLASGGMLPVWSGMVAAAFGAQNFGRAMGLMTPLIAIIIMPGFMIAGWSDDTTGSFVPALRIFVGEIVVAGLLLLALKLPSSTRGDPSSEEN
ncbi:MAG: MFS transporter [Myxococcota bacterium]|nr:MFS transporter [Myxococcota bacterium]